MNASALQKAPLPQILFGLRGWRHPQWIGGFYPEDMPEEWWISYYSNEFRSVLVPQEYFYNTSADQVQSWIDDTDKQFVFFAEMPLSLPWQVTEQLLQPLTPQLGGLIVDTEKFQGLDVNNTEAILHQAAIIGPLITDWSRVSATMKPLMQNVQAGCYWRHPQQSLSRCDGASAVVEIDCDDDAQAAIDAKALRGFVESCISIEGTSTIGVYFDGNDSAIKQARDAQIIYQMLG
ncbi:DUF72 domain-containing protein [Kaarinaea lacus]